MTTVYPSSPRADRPAWLASKTVGDAGEQLVARFFRQLGLLVQQHAGQHPHDLSIGGKIEVKTDRMASSTGNVAVEVSYHGGPSGITNSTASGWAFVIGAEILFASVFELRDLADRYEHRRVRAGEGAICVLVPLAELRRVARAMMIK